MDEKKKQHLEIVVNQYLLENEIDIQEEDKSELIETLINCNYSKAEKGGIVAIRGFVYQYLVTIYYMLLIAKGIIDWDYVVFELGDDVALIKKNKICFCQVKTKADDGGYISFEISKDLVKRKKKIDSWIDKLFLNSNRIKEKMNHVYAEEVSEIEASFKLVLNTIYNSESEIYSYCENTKAEDKEEKLKKKLECVKNYKGEDYKLINELEKPLEFYIENFDIVPLGGYESLFTKNIALVCELINTEDTYVAKKIVEELITFVLFNTHNDNLTDTESKISFIFKKDKIITMIKDKEQNVRNQIELIRQKKVVSTMFENSFKAIRQQFDKQYRSILLEKLNKTMLWLRESLIDKVNEDEYIYEKFINRIFMLDNIKTSCLDGENYLDNVDLTESLKNIIIYMTFYDDKKLSEEKDAKFLIKSGIFKNNKIYLTTYNVRKGKSEIEAVTHLYSNIKKCPVLNTLTNDIICFLLDYTEDLEDEYSIPDFETKITNNNDEFKLVNKPNNLKICRINKLQSFSVTIQKKIDDNTIEKNDAFLFSPYWGKYLEKNVKE